MIIIKRKYGNKACGIVGHLRNIFASSGDFGHFKNGKKHGKNMVKNLHINVVNLVISKNIVHKNMVNVTKEIMTKLK